MRSIIRDLVVPTVLDTGASISIISENLRTKLGVRVHEDRLRINCFHSSADCSGYISASITIGLITETIQLYVIPMSNHDIILGLDNISRFNLHIKSNYEVFQLIDFEGTMIENRIELMKNSSSLQVNLSSFDPVQDRLNKLLSKYSAIFAKHKYDVGCIALETCRIDLTSDIPISLRPYRCSEKDQKLLDDQIQLLLKYKLIEPSNSPYSFPVTLVNKKTEGEKTRLCINFRQLNKIAIADTYSFPRIEDIIDRLDGKKYFNTLDVSCGFWHIKMRKQDIARIAFCTQREKFQWIVMPFGFRNSSAIFQRSLHRVLKEENLTDFADNYIDDILIFSNTLDDHFSHMELVFKAFLKHTIKCNSQKCRYLEDEVEYLGHGIRENFIFPWNSNTIAIEKFPVPHDRKSLQRFLGKVNYYSKCYRNSFAFLLPPQKIQFLPME